MASKIVFVCITMTVFNVVYSQVIGRYGGCGCGGGCGCSNILPVAEQIIGGPYLPSCLSGPSQVIYDQPTTIIQDSTVANNLANALQLLVVSNLLSSTLPFEQNLPVALPSNLALPANLAPLELLSGSYAGAPYSLAPSFLNSSPCGCGSCGCNSCGGPYNFVY